MATVSREPNRKYHGVTSVVRWRVVSRIVLQGTVRTYKSDVAAGVYMFVSNFLWSVSAKKWDEI